MLARAEPHASPSTAVGVRVRALFDEARRRARRRRWAALVALAAAAAVAAVALVVAGHRGLPAVVAPSAATPARLALPEPPGIGVACPAPNIACDRIGIAVRLGTTPRRLVAAIGGHSVPTSPGPS